jgi:hypothetical protein
LQSDLFRAVTGAAPIAFARLNLPADQFAVVVRDFVAAVRWRVWFPTPGKPGNGHGASGGTLMGALQGRSGLDAFGIVGSVLLDATNHLPGDMTSFILGLPEPVRQWLRAASLHWGAGLARSVGMALDAVEQRLRDAHQAQHKARRDAAWARDAERRFRTAAIKRKAARARNRATARSLR